MSKHTPGPWVASARDWTGQEVDNRIYIHGDESVEVNADEDDDSFGSVTTVGVAVCVVPVAEHGEAGAQANARLIVAAPDLLAACEAALSTLDAGTWLTGGMSPAHAMRAAVAKAKGGAA
jgi:hypothetical protein